MMAISPYWTVDLAKTSDDALPLGKTPGEIANHGDTALLDRDRAKPSENPQSAWEKLVGKPPMMAIWLISDRDRAKSSATFNRLGKKSSGNGQ